MTQILRTAGRVLAVSVLTVGTLPLGSSVHADGSRTDTKLAGFNVTVEASPLRIFIDDPKLEIPRDPGTAPLEADPNYTLAQVSAGPNALAITSTFWPGNLLGTGFGALGAPTGYPIQGAARYPDKPYDTAGVDGGALSSAHAEGLDAKAVADGTPTNKPGQVMVGGATATSAASVTEKDVATGTANSAVKDLNLLAGLIKVASVKTTLTTVADGTKASSDGTTEVAGLTIGTNSFTVDEKGLHAAGSTSPLPALDTPAEVYQALGISARTLKHTVATSPGGVSRVAGGLVIDIDTAPLRKTLSPVLGAITPTLIDAIGNLPPEIASQLYYFVKATPHLTFVIASANSKSAATLPLTLPPFEFPAFPSGPITPGGTPGVVSPTGPLPGIGEPPLGSVGPPPIVGGGPGTAPTVPFGPGADLSSSAPDVGGKGIGAMPVLGTLLGAGLVGWALLRFLGLAGGSLLGVGCRLGAPTSVPNLRSVTA